MQTMLGCRIASRSLTRHTPILRRHASSHIPDRSPAPTTAPPRLNIYRDLWPSILKCLGVGYVVYYGLELWRTNLDYKWQAHDQAIEIERLKTKVETLQASNERGTLSKITGGSTSSSESGERKKWSGLF